ncbi:MAG: restriction endonuclease subunit S [Thermoflexaceae bacterium]|nr:restriction endonuclease subunit S [Thermoflexaceae bacterium]
MDADLPDGWTTKRVDQIARVVGGGTPSSETKRFWNGAIPFVTPTDLTALEGRYVSTTERSINEEGRKAAGLEVLPRGSVLLATRASIGLAALSAVPVTTNQGFQNLVPLDGTDSLWLYYAISHRQPELARLAAGTTFRELSRKSLQALGLLVPPALEQRAIAEILDTIDKAIERTEAVIAATERLREALLHELLTRGVPGWHSEWKEVPGLGPVPACWQAVTLGNVVRTTTYGTNRPLDGTGAVRVLRMNNLQQGELDLSDVRRADLSDDEVNDLDLARGDILFNRTNSLDLVGKVGIVRELPQPTSFASYLVRLRVRPEVVDPFWLSAMLASPDYQARIQRFATPGVSQANINPTSLKSLIIPLPGLEEQQETSRMLEALRARSLTEGSEHSVLLAAKAAVGDALLTGRARVPVSMVEPV